LRNRKKKRRGKKNAVNRRGPKRIITGGGHRKPTDDRINGFCLFEAKHGGTGVAPGLKKKRPLLSREWLGKGGDCHVNGPKSYGIQRVGNKRKSIREKLGVNNDQKEGPFCVDR